MAPGMAAAVVIAALAVVTAGLLWGNHTALARNWPVNAASVTQLKAELAAQKDLKASDVVIEKVRQEDLSLRQQYFQLQQRQTWGSYLLLVELAVLAVTLKGAGHSQSPLRPAAASASQAIAPKQAPDAVQQLRSAMWLRNALGLAACGLLAAGVAVNFFSRQGGAKAAATVALPSGAAPSVEQLAANWPRFRGYDGSGICTFADIPTDWDGASLRNILWKTPIELEGANSPIVWGKKVFLTGASKDKREVYCLDADSGKVLWRGEVGGGAGKPPEPMNDTGFAASTAATDGRCVAAMFATGDLACFALDGHLLWTQSLGPLDSTYGYASSLNIYKDLLIVLLDEGNAEDNKSRVVAFHLLTGAKAWETRRPVGGSWASPIIISRVAQPPPAVSSAPVAQPPPAVPAGQTSSTNDQYITCATPFVISYDPASGKELWRAELLSPDVAPSPVFAGGMVYAVNAAAKLSAIRPDGEGNVTATHVAWSAEDGLPDVVSPLSDGKSVLLVTSGGHLTCYRCADGKSAWDKQLDESFRPSPSLVGDHLYLLTKDGTMIIARWGEGFEEIGRSKLGEPCQASPAFAPGRIFLRTEKNLYCIGKK